MLDYNLVIAPMVGYTNKYYRYMMRLITKQTLLFTEMICSASIIHGKKEKFLPFYHQEKPVLFQLAGNNPDELANCASIIEDYGYSGINLNIGCPSQRVQKGNFGVCLMAQPDLIAEIVHNIKKKVSIPVSIKTRLGFDENDNFDFLAEFVQKTSQAGCQVFFIHARKALLNFNPRKNRSIPDLDYERVKKLKSTFPHLKIILNGGITLLNQALDLTKEFDGVMLGRSAYQNPLLFQTADSLFFGKKDQNNSIIEIIENFLEFVSIENKNKFSALRHLFNLFYKIPNASYLKQLLHKQIQLYPKNPWTINKEIQEFFEKPYLTT